MKQKWLLLAFTLVGVLAGCGQVSTEEPRQHLPITVVEDGSDGVTNRHFTTENLNGNYKGTLYYTFLKEVNVEINGKRYPLADAIRDGHITAEELVALAQADAHSGFCTETSLTENGLTQFTYTYQDSFQMESINDILETPDGKEHRIQRLSFTICGAVSDGLGTFLADGGGPTDYLDKEDWGLTFSLAKTSPNGIVIQCTQSGGQQFGELVVLGYTLYSNEFDWHYDTAQDTLQQPVSMNDSTIISIDWAKDLSSLSPGSYWIRLRIEDRYDQEDVPPLSRNYHDRQSYELDFTIE